MQTNSFLRTVAAMAAAGTLAACSSADNPYAAIKDPPLLKATLHTVTLQSADGAVIEQRVQQGFTRMPEAPNYPGSVRVEAALWKVPEDVAAAPVVLLASAGGVNHRFLVMAPAPAKDGPIPDFSAEFYETVLGADTNSWADAVTAPARLHALTFMVDDILAARKKLQEAGIPITFSPVAITTAYLGDHKLLGITAPDGVIIELVETAAQ
jgi:hypothetical protein